MVEAICGLTKNQLTIAAVEMELTDILIFVVIVGIAYVVFKIIDKKMGP